MEGTERERERLAASSPARPAAPSSPEAASPHVVVDVVEDEETVPTPAANSSVPRLRPPPPTPTTKPTSEDSTLPTPPPRTPTGKPEGKASTTASTPAAGSSVPRLPTPTGKGTPEDSPPPPPPPRTPTGKPEEKAFTTASTPASDSVKPDGKAPPPPPPPNPCCFSVLNTSHRPQLPASKVSSSSAGNPVPHPSPARSDLSEDEDTMFRLHEIELTKKEQNLKEEIKMAKKLRNEDEIRRRTKEIALMQWKEEMDNREAILARKEQEVRAAQMLDREKKLKSREDALTVPLLEQEGQSKQNKDDAVWDKRQNIMAISLACGLSVLISMQPLLPPDYLKWTVGSFAIVWALTTIALPAGLFGTSSLPYHTARALPPHRRHSYWSLGFLQWTLIPFFYGGLGVFTLVGHISLWILGCVTGGDKDP
ncbi:hypothetical protein ACQ4PT_064026 [Festuca glaucescens]